jgi:hypothetical protein
MAASCSDVGALGFKSIRNFKIEIMSVLRRPGTSGINPKQRYARKEEGRK